MLARLDTDIWMFTTCNFQRVPDSPKTRVTNYNFRQLPVNASVFRAMPYTH
jgi:hypothetical protein